MDYQPIFQLTRGNIVESTHFGSLAVVNSQGELLASIGDPHTVTYLRSTAKPFQALPFLVAGGDEEYHLSEKEIALICSSHSGTDEHVETLQKLQKKIGITEDDLLCGIHPPYHKPTRKRLKEQGDPPTPNRHNCSGKHTGMLGLATLLDAPLDSYLEANHPVQQKILATLTEMCSISVEEIEIGVDGCSVPTFAMPLYNAAWGMARLADPDGFSFTRKNACHKIYAAMTNQPDMVAGPGRLDTTLMETTGGKLVSKSGAEAFQGLGIPPETLPDSDSGLGIVIKIADGDRGKRAKTPVVIEVLKQLGILSDRELKALVKLGPRIPLKNYRDILIGYGQPELKLEV